MEALWVSIVYLSIDIQVKEFSLVRRVLAKDKQAEQELFHLLSPRLFVLCQRYAHDDSHAKDLLQECFIKIFLKLEKFDLNKKGSLKSWTYKLSLNTILTHIRKRKKTIILDEVSELPDMPVGTEVELYGISDKQLMSAIQKLPEHYKYVINFKIFEGFSHAQIAEELGIAVATSRSHYNRAKTLLKKILKPEVREYSTYE